MNTDSKYDSEKESEQSHRYHDAELKHKMHLNAIAFVFTLLSALAYLVWAFMSVDYKTWYVGGAYLFAEVICFGSLLIWSGMMMHRRDHPKSGLPLQDPPPPVDVIVTCCGEPFRVIEKTLKAVSHIDYPDYKVTVADDAADADVAMLCEKLGFTYLNRGDLKYRKAGNLNHAYTNTHHPFLLVLDCDQIPHYSILTHLMGYFTVPSIGFVVSYQSFDVPKGDPWGNRDRVFYSAMQPAKNNANAAISCGSGVIYRRAALNQVGGFSTWNLVEDLYTSLLLHAAGWKSVYHPFPLTHGTAPAEITTHCRQRWQWAVDSLRLFFWRNPMFTKGLNLRQKLNYFDFGYNYLLFGIAYPVFFFIPIWGLFSGQFFMDTSALEFVIWRTPYAITYLILNRLVTDKRHTIKTFRAQVGLFQVYMGAIITALLCHKKVPEYKVSQKTVRHDGFTSKARHVMLHILVIILSLAGIIYGFVTGNLSNAHHYINTAWALWVVWLLMPFVILALRPPPEKEFR